MGEPPAPPDDAWDPERARRPYGLADLVGLMARLRSPEGGCPWDLEQTFATIAPYTVEEAYEVADAIERGDLADLKEELGDLLLQVVYHSQLAAEAKAFALPQVIDAITAKMVRRHPHVFGDESARAAGAAKGFWERIKAEEKRLKAEERARLAQAGAARPSPAPSLLDDIPTALPGLTRAIKLQDRAARVGFDWPSLKPVFEKVAEEMKELEATFGEDDFDHQEEELGDLLFVVANVARHLKIDPEAALRRANAKFVRRFRHIETRLAAQGSAPAQSTLEEMDQLWDEAKMLERK